MAFDLMDLDVVGEQVGVAFSSGRELNRADFYDTYPLLYL